MVVGRVFRSFIEQALGTKGKSNCRQIGVRSLTAAPFGMNDEVFNLEEAVQAAPSRDQGAPQQALPARGSFGRLQFPILGRRQRSGQEGVEQAAAGGGGGCETRLQSVAERHQRIDLGDDAVLFGEGWKGNRICPDRGHIHARRGAARRARLCNVRNERRIENYFQKIRAGFGSCANEHQPLAKAKPNAMRNPACNA
jgi:hypothetical protein